MPKDTLSAREAALIAQARAELDKHPGVDADAAAPPESGAARREPAQRTPGRSIAGANGAAPAGVIQVVTLGGAARAPATDPARRAAALLAAARAESERRRLRRQKLNLRIAAGIAAACGVCAAVWMWLRT